MTAYYNEYEPYAAAWLRNLIAAGLIAPGDVDERSITEVRADDLRGYTQCHFFAGIGGWSYALRLAGWPDDRPVWTGSCPCQPFSVAGKRKGFDDERHLWPVWGELIRECRPPVVFGEQVASAGRWPGDLQGLRDREAVERVLRGLGVGHPSTLQELLEGSGDDEEGAARRQGAEERGAQGIPEEEPSAGAFASGGVSSARQGDRVLALAASGGPSGDHRHGLLPVDGDRVRSGRRQDVEQPVARPDRLFEGVHEGERPACPLLRERDVEHLGAEQDPRDRGSDTGGEIVEVGPAAGEAGDGSEVASNWLAGVRGDLEALGYAVGAVPIEAASVGAPHKRDRFWFVADASSTGRQAGRRGREPRGPADDTACRSQDLAGSELADTDGAGSQPRERDDPAARHAEGDGRGEGRRQSDRHDAAPLQGRPGELSRSITAWDGAVWLTGADGKARRVEPGIRLLAHGVRNRVGRLRAYGNAIVPQVAAEFIEAYLESRA